MIYPDPIIGNNMNELKSKCCGKCDDKGEPGYISCDRCDCHKPCEIQADKPSPESKREREIYSIVIDCWANINNSLQRDGVKFKGDGIGTAYGGWVALKEILYPRIKNLLVSHDQAILDWAEKPKAFPLREDNPQYSLGQTNGYYIAQADLKEFIKPNR